MEKTHCFAYIDKHRCNALTEKNCYNCPFYKSQTQYDIEIEESRKLCKEKRITKYNSFFRYYKLRKLLTSTKGVEANERTSDIQK